MALDRDPCDATEKELFEKNPSALESDLVHKVYENIADHFTQTRQKPWPNVVKFVESLEPGSALLDVGCANGKYFGINKDIIEVGMDMSTGLLQKCFEKGQETVRGNALHIPLRDTYFDAVISIAVLHHISTKERRKKFIWEILRVLKDGGVAMIYVWAQEQNKNNKKSAYAKRNSALNKASTSQAPANPSDKYSFLPIHEGGDFKSSDMLVPWVNKQKTQNEIHHRYYHLFSEGELEGLLSEFEPCSKPKVIDHYYEEGNWVVVFQKVFSSDEDNQRTDIPNIRQPYS